MTRANSGRWMELLAAGLAVLACSGPATAGTPRYRAVNETRYGKAWVAERQDAPTVAEAVRLTLLDAGAFFGAKPKLGRAYEEARGGRAGGATFTVDAGGAALQGWMTCEVGKPSTQVTVAVIRADAPPGAWRELTRPGADASASAPSAQSGSAPPAPGGLPAPAHVPLSRHVFEDGIASVGLAEGWTTSTRAAMDGALLQGPQGQAVWFGAGYNVQTPQGMRLPGALVAPFTSPLQALQAIHPQVNQLVVRSGGPSSALDHVTAVADLKPSMPGGRQALLRYGVTERRRDGSAVHYLAAAQVEVFPVTQTSWRLTTLGMRAPDAIFERDLPMMLQMAQSVKYDDAMIARRTGERLHAQNQWFANQQAGYRARQAANDAQHQRYWDGQRQSAQRNQAWEDQQLAQDRRNDNHAELMRGYRTVEDTQTGERRSADYFNVDQIVDDLNRAEPDRFRQIPLRDELHPLDGR